MGTADTHKEDAMGGSITDYPYTYTLESGSNDEGSTWAVVNIRFADGTEEDHRFWASFEDPIESAYVQAVSFLNALYESVTYTLEERLGPYGIEWQREQADRLAGGVA